MIELNDDLRKYAFSNIFEVAGAAQPFERVAVIVEPRICRRGGADRRGLAVVRRPARRIRRGDGRRGGLPFREDGGRPGPRPRRWRIQLGAEANGPVMGKVTAARPPVLLPKGAAYRT